MCPTIFFLPGYLGSDQDFGVTNITVTTSDHGALSGLGDDDHTQYFLANGSRNLSGHIVPSADITHNLGQVSPVRRFNQALLKEIYLDDFAEIQETTEPAAPASNKGRLFVVDNGAGKSSLRIRFASGATQTIATEP